MTRKSHSDTFKVLKKNWENYQPRNLYPAKVFFVNNKNKNKTFHMYIKVEIIHH